MTRSIILLVLGVFLFTIPGAQAQHGGLADIFGPFPGMDSFWTPGSPQAAANYNVQPADPYNMSWGEGLTFIKGLMGSVIQPMFDAYAAADKAEAEAAKKAAEAYWNPKPPKHRAKRANNNAQQHDPRWIRPGGIFNWWGIDWAEPVPEPPSKEEELKKGGAPQPRAMSPRHVRAALAQATNTPAIPEPPSALPQAI